MPAVQRDFVLKYYWAGLGNGDGPWWLATTSNESVRRMMRAATKRARAARAMGMVMRVVGNKEGEAG
jgi:hypothetical protein